MNARPGTVRVLAAQIDALDWSEATARLLRWARRAETRYVAVCNVHVVVTCARDAQYERIVNAADMATPDGAPVAWMLRRLGYSRQHRISGPDFMWELCVRCQADGLPIYCYGSNEATLIALEANLMRSFPGLCIAGMESPPYRPLCEGEDRAAVERINSSGARIVFVGLGCPKQEQWMSEHKNKVRAVMIGVGAAFDFHAGTVVRAPRWMRRCGLEWLHRVASEPRRLWKRYLVTNTLFVIGAAKQLLFRH